MSLTFALLPKGKPERATPYSAWIGPALATLGQRALCREVQHTLKLAMVLFVSRGGDELRPSGIDDVQDLRETQLPGIEVVPPCRQTHHCTNQIVGRDGHPQFLLHHLFALDGHVVQSHRPLQRA